MLCSRIKMTCASDNFLPHKTTGRHLEQRGHMHCDSQGKKVTKANSWMHQEIKGSCCDSPPVLQHWIHWFHAIGVYFVKLISKLDRFLQPLHALRIPEIHQGQVLQVLQHFHRHFLLYKSISTDKKSKINKFNTATFFKLETCYTSKPEFAKNPKIVKSGKDF